MPIESAQSLRNRGQLARKAFPRKELGVFTPVDRDPALAIQTRDKGRIPELVPIRHQRMAASEFAFFRGSAGLMAYDLSHQAQTDVQLVICGDAHISNFGLYASPERRLVFDLNDFDEAAPGPWEWDVKRLLTSAILAARENGFPADATTVLVEKAARQYREMLQDMLTLPAIERHYVSVDESDIANEVRTGGIKGLAKTTAKARKRDADRTIAHLMQPDKMGYIRFVENPPILTHALDIPRHDIERLFAEYRETTLPDINLLMSTYEVSDVAMRVVGVGSVGTRCYLVALTAPEGNGIVMQVKEAMKSVVQTFSQPNSTTPRTLPEGATDGQRIVIHQRILQAVSDPFLGHIAGPKRSFYSRQYRDAKGSFDTTAMDLESLSNYVSLCATMLARAHSQSPYAHWVGGYMGDSATIDVAFTSWCTQYAEQVSKDYQDYLQAIAEGRVEVAPEIIS